MGFDLPPVLFQSDIGGANLQDLTFVRFARHNPDVCQSQLRWTSSWNPDLSVVKWVVLVGAPTYSFSLLVVVKA